MKILYLDCETAGLDQKQNPITQISGIIEIDGESVREFDFNLCPHPNAVIDPKALEVNHLTHENLLDPGRLEHTAVYKKLKSIFLTYIDRYNKEDKFYLMGQNVHFDYGFLLELWKRNNDDYLGSFIHYHKIDLIALTATLRIAGVLTKEKAPNLKLETLCKLFNLEAQTHNSIDDIRKTRTIFLRMVQSLKGVNLFQTNP